MESVGEVGIAHSGWTPYTAVEEQFGQTQRGKW